MAPKKHGRVSSEFEHKFYKKPVVLSTRKIIVIGVGGLLFCGVLAGAIYAVSTITYFVPSEQIVGTLTTTNASTTKEPKTSTKSPVTEGSSNQKETTTKTPVDNPTTTVGMGTTDATAQSVVTTIQSAVTTTQSVATTDAATTEVIVTTPAPTNIDLDAGCDERDTIISCTDVKCASVNSSVWQCAFAISTEEVTIDCFGDKIMLQNSSGCSCTDCENQNPTKVISGRAKTTDGSPLSAGTIEVDGTRIGGTLSNGDFEITVQVPQTLTISLLFKPPEGNSSILPTRKIFNLDVDGPITDVEVIINVANKIEKINTTAEVNISLEDGGSANESTTFSIQPNTVVDQNGNTFTGDVEISMRSIDTSNEGDIESTPGTFESTEGTLVSGGMFSVTNTCGTSECSLTNVTVTPPPAIQGANFLFWALNDAGAWQRITDLNNVRLDSGRMYNWDKLLSGPLRYLRVRTYHSATSTRELKPSSISYVYKDKDDNWMTSAREYIYTYTTYGACVRIPIIEDVKTIHFTARYKTTSLLVADLGDMPTSHQITYGESTDGKVKTFSIAVDGSESNLFTREECRSSDILPEFKFYGDNIPLYEDYNSIYFVEASFTLESFTFSNPNSAYDSPRFWWPNQSSLRACYIKIKLEGVYTGKTLMSTNSLGVLTNHENALVGGRFTTPGSDDLPDNIACLEYKCSDYVTSSSLFVYTRLQINSAKKGECYLTNVNEELLSIVETTAETVNRNISSTIDYKNQQTNVFDIYAPADFLVRNGLYTAEGGKSATAAKKLAKNKCLSGENFQPNNIVPNDKNVAITFMCT